MSDSVCRFIPSKNVNSNIRTVNFVYETEFKKFSQPFIKPIFFLHLVVKGTGVLKFNGSKYELKPGTVYFAFPGYPFEIEAEDDFKYYYISFMGTNINELLENLDISPEKPVYPDFEHIIDFWKKSIDRINSANANILTESVLLYTLSYIYKESESSQHKNNLLLEKIVEYIDTNYTDTDISLIKIADIFSYSPKYISHLLKKNMNIKFTDYLTSLRIQYALKLIDENEVIVSQIASKCGFVDSMYFSKVFKKAMGKTPSNYIKSRND